MSRPIGGRTAWAFVLAVILGATACAEDEPFVAYIGVVDATPPRLGRPLTALSPSDAGADASSLESGTDTSPVEAGADASLDGGVDALSPGDAAQDPGSGEEIRDSSSLADSEASPD